MEIVYKIQETCNIDCSYCYMYNVGNTLFKSVPPSSPLDVVESVANFICDAFEDWNPSRVSLIIHGGEPMLMPAHQFAARMELIGAVLDRRLTPDQRDRVEFSIQTNGTLVTEAWIALLARWKILVGITVDGREAVHDRRRVDKKGRGSYQATIRGLELLRTAAREGRISKPGGLCVIDPTASGGETYDHLVNDLGFDNINFLFPFMNWSNYAEEDVEGASRFLLDALDRWMKGRAAGQTVHVRVFTDALRAMHGFGRGVYQRTPGQRIELGHQVTIVESDGTIMPEESLRPTFEHRFADLHVASDRARDIVSDPRFGDLVRADLTRSTECAGCVLIDVCESGHALGRVGMRFVMDGDFSRKSVYCGAYAGLFAGLAHFMSQSGVGVEDILTGERRHVFAA
nr:radical SAM protein [Brevundimonas variabilis]